MYKLARLARAPKVIFPQNWAGLLAINIAGDVAQSRETRGGTLAGEIERRTWPILRQQGYPLRNSFLYTGINLSAANVTDRVRSFLT